jgi:hypothetical protein
MASKLGGLSLEMLAVAMFLVSAGLANLVSVSFTVHIS